MIYSRSFESALWTLLCSRYSDWWTGRPSE